jgi:hypothetical protein
VLKALGAGMVDLARIVVEQGLICGALGVVLGMGISVFISRLAVGSGTSVEIPPGLAVALLALPLCSTSSLFSIARLKRVEPALVFRT